MRDRADRLRKRAAALDVLADLVGTLQVGSEEEQGLWDIACSIDTR